MEPMADCSTEKRENDELLKFSVGLTDEGRGAAGVAVGTTRKRNREGSEGAEDEESQGESGEAAVKVAKRRKGPRQPNPLSCKKKKRALPVKFLPNPTNTKTTTLATKNSISKPATILKPTLLEGEKESMGNPEVQVRKKRKRKHTRSGKILANGSGDVGGI